VPLPVSVVICTRTRPEMVDACLDSLLRENYPAFEVIIVDNTDTGDFSLRASGDARVRVVREARRGLSRARNTGIRSARYEVLAFIDDDVTVDSGWIRAIASALEDDSIAGVTGLIVPTELETEAQREFEWYGGMGKGTERRLMCGTALTAWQTIRAQEVGVGANMAFRRSVFERVGGFDEALGAGTVTLGAEDLDFFHRVLREGLTLCYEPAARVKHRHRRTVTELRSQTFANGCSYSVYLMKIWSRRTVPRSEVGAFALSWFAGRLATALFRSITRPGVRCLLAWEEVRGATRAPAAYRLAYGRSWWL
jgi:GT2 family glycosyltransferase